MKKLSVVINTYNEAKILPRALKSIKGLADEIVIVDTESTDNIKEVAKKFGAIVFPHAHSPYVEPLRNFSISKTSGDWVLVLDPDEEIPQSLVKQIKKVVAKGDADYYRIPRKNIILGKWMEHTLWWPDYQIRLFKKGKVSWNEIIHSVPITLGQGKDFEPKEGLAILHHNYQSVEQYIEKLNRYTSVQAKILIDSGYKFDWRDLMLKPFKEFVNRYFTGRGYKDGLHGLALSLTQSFSELVVYLKVWQENKFVSENPDLKDVLGIMRIKEKELHYWQHDAEYKETGNFGARIKRKLRI